LCSFVWTKARFLATRLHLINELAVLYRNATNDLNELIEDFDRLRSRWFDLTFKDEALTLARHPRCTSKVYIQGARGDQASATVERQAIRRGSRIGADWGRRSC
jgi:hypothetical protein